MMSSTFRNLIPVVVAHLCRAVVTQEIDSRLCETIPEIILVFMFRYGRLSRMGQVALTGTEAPE